MTISTSTLKLRDERFQDLLQELNELFAVSGFTPNQSLEEIMYRSGQASVVAFLEEKFLEE
jgi:hypothetical protein